MVLQGKLEIEIEIKAPAAKFYNILRKQNHHIPNISDSIHAIDLHEGDWETPGSVKQWTYTLGKSGPLNYYSLFLKIYHYIYTNIEEY